MDGHLLTLGDSVFDNTVYLESMEKDGEAWLKEMLPNYHHTFLALDGATTDTVYTQLDYVEDAVKKVDTPITDIALSIGGNNLLSQSYVLDLPARAIIDGMSAFRQIQEKFDREYTKLIAKLLKEKHKKSSYAKVCRLHIFGIYYACFTANQTDPHRKFPTDKKFQEASRMAVDMFNYVIQNRVYSNFIDLNMLFERGTNELYYANPIEPSSYSSETIAYESSERIKRMKNHD